MSLAAGIADADGLIGLERTDNNLDLTNWPQITPINQKNYYTFVMMLYLLSNLLF